MLDTDQFTKCTPARKHCIINPCPQPRRVRAVHGIVVAEGVDVPSALQPDRVLRDPPSGLRVVPPAVESDETRVGIVEPALEPERLEAGAGVAGVRNAATHRTSAGAETTGHSLSRALHFAYYIKHSNRNSQAPS